MNRDAEKRVIERAKQKNISPYLELKRTIDFRRAGTDRLFSGKICKNCKDFIESPITGCSGKYNCQYIGINKDFHAFVGLEYTCKKFKRIRR